MIYSRINESDFNNQVFEFLTSGAMSNGMGIEIVH